MELDRLLGNEALKEKLAPCFAHNRLSHSYLLTGPEGSGKHTLATILAAAMECTGSARPCGKCPQCRKVFAGVHPDVITVDDTAHKTVTVGVVRAARQDLYIRPNEGRRKVYLYPRAKDLGPAGENALLKVMEEPPEYGAYLLLAETPQQLLPTIRSRCVNLQLSPLGQDVCVRALKEKFPQASSAACQAAWAASGGFLGQAISIFQQGAVLLPQSLTFAQAYAAGDSLGLTKLLVSMEKLKRDALEALLRQWQLLLAAALQAQAGMPCPYPEAGAIAQRRAGAELLQAVQHLDRAQRLCQTNVATGALCGWLQVQLISSTRRTS